MGDSLFEQLFALLQSSGPVNWKIAREVTKSLVGEPEPIEPALAEEYRELAHAAELRIAAATELPPAAVGDLQPTDRTTWAADNQEAFGVLVEPFAETLGSSLLDTAPAGMAAMLQPLGPALLGIQAGTMVGFMSHRVLGQFDGGVPTAARSLPYLLVPNVEAFATDHAIERREVRLWAATKEMAFHRILAVEWVPRRFATLVAEFASSVRIDLGELMGRLRSLDDPAGLEELFGEASGGLGGLVRQEADPARLAAVQALAAFVEGYGDHVAHAALADVLLELGRIEEAYARRRAEPDEAERFLQQFAGLTLERHRARDAATFCAEVERRWGPPALAGIWSDPARLPRLEEFADPVGWAARVLLD